MNSMVPDTPLNWTYGLDTTKYACTLVTLIKQLFELMKATMSF